MLGFCSFGCGLISNMMAYYHILMKQFSCSLNKDCKQVLESNAWLTFPQIYQRKDWCASLKRLKFFQDMLSIWFSSHSKRKSNQLRLKHIMVYLKQTWRSVHVNATQVE